jgi:hypothetical protein
VLLGLEIPILPRKTIEGLFRVPLFLLLCMTPGLSQKAKQDDGHDSCSRAREGYGHASTR